MSQLIVGLTGGIGSGKTTVSDLFAAKGIDIVDADVIARDVVKPGTPALSEIASYFGDGILTAQGELDRKALRDIVFSSPEKKDWLNSLLHPAIRNEMISQCQSANSPYCILSVPLLVENGLNKLVNRVLVVDVTESNQVSRTASRDDTSEKQVQQIMAAQASRQERLAAADDIVDNNGEPDALKVQIERLHEQYLSIVSSAKGLK